MNQESFFNLLLTYEVEIEKSQTEKMTLWQLASKIWSKALEQNQDALTLVSELFVNKDEIPLFLETSKAGDSVMKTSAIAILAFGIQDKLEAMAQKTCN